MLKIKFRQRVFVFIYFYFGANGATSYTELTFNYALN